MKLTEAAWTSIKISSLAGIGSSISPMRRSSEPVNASQSTAFIAALQSDRDRTTAWGGAQDLAGRRNGDVGEVRTWLFSITLLAAA
jgi:hypothetical protein